MDRELGREREWALILSDIIICCAFPYLKYLANARQIMGKQHIGYFIFYLLVDFLTVITSEKLLFNITTV